MISRTGFPATGRAGFEIANRLRAHTPAISDVGVGHSATAEDPLERTGAGKPHNALPCGSFGPEGSFGKPARCLVLWASEQSHNTDRATASPMADSLLTLFLPYQGRLASQIPEIRRQRPPRPTASAAPADRTAHAVGASTVRTAACRGPTVRKTRRQGGSIDVR